MATISPSLESRTEGLTAGQIIAKHQKTAPVNVVAIAEDLGLKVWETRSLAENISGKIFRDPVNGGPSGFSIAVNAGEGILRKRFTVAHEIAHFILHRRQLDDGELVDDTMYRSGLSTAEEAQANKLAAQILMPNSLIESLVTSGIRDVEALANTLQVSATAMKIRLGIPT
jgi:Zn-dependent peptidase ImmA (M78 family)